MAAKEEFGTLFSLDSKNNYIRNFINYYSIMLKSVFDNRNILNQSSELTSFSNSQKSLRKNALITSLGQVFSNLWGVGLPLIFSIFMNEKFAGYYSVASLVSIKPVTIISSSISSVFWQYVCINLRKNPCAVRKKYINLSKILILPAIFVPLLLSILFCQGVSYINPDWIDSRFIPFMLIP